MQLKTIIFISLLANSRAWSRVSKSERVIPKKNHSQYQTMDLLIHERNGRRASTDFGYHQQSQTLSCDDAMQGDGDRGSYIINIPNQTPFYVYCETDPDGGPAWALIQRRMDGSLNFDRDWSDYKEGFGHIEGEYWMGLESIHALTTSVRHELWIEMLSWNNVSRSAKYKTFAIGSEKQKYALNVLGEYMGDAGDALGKHAGAKFSTFDMDSSAGCAHGFKGGWWFIECYYGYLNGEYVSVHNATKFNGIKWNSWLGEHETLKYVHMGIRPLQ